MPANETDGAIEDDTIEAGTVSPLTKLIIEHATEWNE